MTSMIASLPVNAMASTSPITAIIGVRTPIRNSMVRKVWIMVTSDVLREIRDASITNTTMAAICRAFSLTLENIAVITDFLLFSCYLLSPFSSGNSSSRSSAAPLRSTMHSPSQIPTGILSKKV